MTLFTKSSLGVAKEWMEVAADRVGRCCHGVASLEGPLSE